MVSNFLTKILTYKTLLLPVIVALLAFTLAQLGISFRSWLDNRKILKTVLFHLLETYYCIDRSDPDRYLGKIIRKVVGMIPGQVLDESALNLANRAYGPIIKSMLSQYMAPDVQEISKEYQKSILALAAIAPFTAYYLSRRNNIEEVFKSFSSSAEQLGWPSSGDHAIEQSMQIAFEALKPKIFEDSLIELEADILRVARKIGPYTWLQAGQTVKHIKRRVGKNMEKDLEQFLKDLMPRINIAIQAMDELTQQHRSTSSAMAGEDVS